ncbi:hypothetical protein FRX31_026442, partial [Thalictrum thalictroides]
MFGQDQFALDGKAGGSFPFDTSDDEFSSSNLLNAVAWPEQTYPAGPGDQSPPLQVPSFSQSRKTGLLSDIFLPTAPQEFAYDPSTPMQIVPIISYNDSTGKGKAVVQYSDDQHHMPTYEELMRMPYPNLLNPIKPFEYVKKKQLQSYDSVNGMPNQNQTYPSKDSKHLVYGK